MTPSTPIVEPKPAAAQPDASRIKPPVPPRPQRPAVAPMWVRITASVVLTAVFLAVGSTIFSALTGLKEEPPREDPPPPLLRIESFVLERADLEQFVSGFGTARADREVVVSAEVAGRIQEKESLKVGMRVSGPEITIAADGRSVRKGGDLLVQVDPQTYAERVDQAHALVTQDRIALERLDREHATNLRLLDQQRERLKTIQAELQRFEALLASGAGRETEVQRTRLEVEQYRESLIRLENEEELYPIRQKELTSRLAAHQNDLRLAELELEKASVYAPFTGVLSEVWVEQGQYVRPGDPLVRITDVDVVEVPVPLSLSNAALIERLIAEGRYPRVELARNQDQFKSSAGNVWIGRIRRIDPVADERTRTVLAFVEVDNRAQDTPLRPGTFAYARMQAGEVPAARGLLIPRDALVGGHVYVVSPPEPAIGSENGNGPGVEHAANWQYAVRRPVEIRETIQTFALVDGLQPGERIVVTNLDIMREGTLLDVQKTRTLDEEFQRLKVPYLQRAGDQSRHSR